MVNSGWLDGFSDLQRDLPFGSNLTDRVVELRKEADFFSVLSFLGCDKHLQRKELMHRKFGR